MKQALFIIITTLFSLNIYAQVDKNQYKTLRYGNFFKNNIHDSIFVYRDFLNWHEIDLRSGYHRVFDITWVNESNFFLTLTKVASTENKFDSLEVGDVLFLTAMTSTDNQLIFEAYYNGIKNYLSLIRTQDNVLKVITDQNGKYRELLKERRKNLDKMISLMPQTVLHDSLKKKYKKTLSYENIIKSRFSNIQLLVIESFIYELRQEDYNAIYNMASKEFKQRIPKIGLFQYLKNLEKYYGKLETYKCFSFPSNLRISKGLLKNNSINGQPYTYQYEFLVKFSKGDELYKLTLTFKSIKNSEELYNIKISKNEYTPFDKLEKVCENFFRKVNENNYKTIYNNSAKIIKNKTTYKEFRSTVKLIKSFKNDKKFHLYRQTFIPTRNSKTIVQLLFLTSIDRSELTLYYVLEDRCWKLGGLDIKKQK